MSTAFAYSSSSLSTFHVCSRLAPHGVERSRPVRWRMCARSSNRSGIYEWVVSCGGKTNPALKITEERPTLISESSVLKDAEIISIPGSIVLSTASGSKTFGPEFSKFSPQAQLAILLLTERAKGEESAFYFLVDELTQRGDLDHPYLWTGEQLEWLHGSSLKEAAAQVRSGLKKEWSEVKKFVGSSASLEDYLWAHGAVDSHAFELGSSFPLALVPLVHLAERATQTNGHNVKVVATASNFFSKPRILMMATRDITSGSSLLVGCPEPDLSASEFLLNYGTLPMANGAVAAPSSVELTFAVSNLDRFYDDKADVLERNRQVECPTFLLTDSLERGAWIPPDGMEQFIRMLCLGGQDAFLLEGVFRRDVWDFMNLPISLQNEKAMCEAVIGACEDAIERYSQFDVQGLEADQRSRGVTARSIVEGEKRVLTACLEYYEQEIQSLEAKEYYQERRLNDLDLLRPLDESEIVDSDAARRMSRSFDENY